MEKENKNLEYKERISKTYLKTVSAFSNYNDGKIIFGVSDDLIVVGIENPNEACLNIENQINDSIKPRPNYTLQINNDNTITLFVKQGEATPYKYNGKVYKRYNSSTIEADNIEENRLILSGLNISFEEMNIGNRPLTFEVLKKDFKTKLDLESFNIDTLKSLNLYNTKTGYNNAALLLADENNFPGLDIVVFGSSMNIFKKRECLAGESILKQYFDALELYKGEYVIEKIETGYRKKYELIPLDAFREAIANALVHRVWDIKANTKVEMHPDKIIISSPGGLAFDMSKEDYINRNYSYLRNPIVANVFRRLDIIEAFATGIKRINNSYKESLVKPIYDVTSSAISVTLPIIDQNVLTENEKIILTSMKTNYSYSRVAIESVSGFSKDTLIRILNSLITKGLIEKKGKARATFYLKK